MIVICYTAEYLYTIGQAMLTQSTLNPFNIRFYNLNHRTGFFRKQTRQYIAAQCNDVYSNTTMPGKRHFAQGDKQTTIGSIVISQNFVIFI